jgi:hypothetical protein
MAWTEEQKQEVIKMYTDAEPTAETSTEIIKDIAEQMEQSANGVRQILILAKVYVKKEPGAASSKPSKEGAASTRVSKDTLITNLKNVIKDMGGEVNDEILDKMTGKAAEYFTNILTNATEAQDD